MQTEINKQWIYEQSPEEVWEYLTQPDLLALWLMPNNFKAVADHEFQFRTKPIPSLDLDGIMHCKVQEIIPFKKLTYTWKAGPGNNNFPLDTIVEWTLEPLRNGTKLSLKHSGFNAGNINIFSGMTDGWQKNIQKMTDHLKAQKNGSSQS